MYAKQPVRCKHMPACTGTARDPNLAPYGLFKLNTSYIPLAYGRKALASGDQKDPRPAHRFLLRAVAAAPSPVKQSSAPAPAPANSVSGNSTSSSSSVRSQTTANTLVAAASLTPSYLNYTLTADSEAAPGSNVPTSPVELYVTESNLQPQVGGSLGSVGETLCFRVSTTYCSIENPCCRMDLYKMELLIRECRMQGWDCEGVTVPGSSCGRKE